VSGANRYRGHNAKPRADGMKMPAVLDRIPEAPGGPILLYDGLCNLCSGFVRFVIARDRAGKIAYAPLQSPAIGNFLLEHGVDATRLDTMACVEGGRVFTKSTAVIRIVRTLPGGWRAVALLAAIPAPLRDLVYDFVGRNRYGWFGRSEACFVPSPHLGAERAPPRPDGGGRPANGTQ
jgi:predicted DCC family thiol-disulfide oxidoreductase YuxK